jgi:hypothetical protein
VYVLTGDKAIEAAAALDKIRRGFQAVSRCYGLDRLAESEPGQQVELTLTAMIDPAAVRALEWGAKQLQGKQAAESPEPPAAQDDSAWVAAGKLWKNRPESASYKERSAFLAKHPEIRRRYPIAKKTGKEDKRRPQIHSGDWFRYWTSVDAATFDSLDTADGKKPLQPLSDMERRLAPEQTEAFLTGATRLMAKVRKKPGK